MNRGERGIVKDAGELETKEEMLTFAAAAAVRISRNGRRWFRCLAGIQWIEYPAGKVVS